MAPKRAIPARQKRARRGTHSQRNREYFLKLPTLEGQAREALWLAIVADNMSLVWSIAGQYAKRAPASNMTIEDLVQDGAIGLLKALEKFDPARGVAFGTHATWWIRQAITRKLYEQSGPHGGHTPVNESQLIQSIKREKDRLEQRLGRVPTEAEIMRLFLDPDDGEGLAQELLRKRLERALFLAEARPLLLDWKNDEGEAVGHNLIASHEPSPEQTVVEEQGYEELQQIVLAFLQRFAPPRAVYIVTKRLGLEGAEIPSLSSLAEEIGITREGVRQMEIKYLRRLRRHLKNLKITTDPS